MLVGMFTFIHFDLSWIGHYWRRRPDDAAPLPTGRAISAATGSIGQRVKYRARNKTRSLLAAGWKSRYGGQEGKGLRYRTFYRAPCHTRSFLLDPSTSPKSFTYFLSINLIKVPTSEYLSYFRNVGLNTTTGVDRGCQRNLTSRSRFHCRVTVRRIGTLSVVVHVRLAIECHERG